MWLIEPDERFPAPGPPLLGPPRNKGKEGQREGGPKQAPGLKTASVCVDTDVMRLYWPLLKKSQNFAVYGYRTYAIRRIKDAFRENKNINDSTEIETLLNKAKTNLKIICRQLDILTLLCKTVWRFGVLH
uniref:Complex 1 LYR protein domain-containing protein n=1 Tax=Anolis carolinensis TaxID=28377 RepID=A0A803SZ02_ANOCA